MKYEYRFFLLAGAFYQAEPFRQQMTEWLNGIGAEGWDVFQLGQQRDNPAGWVAWAKRPVQDMGGAAAK